MTFPLGVQPVSLPAQPYEIHRHPDRSGISAESGLKTFRDGGGLWEGRSVEDVATFEAFENDPETVNRF